MEIKWQREQLPCNFPKTWGGKCLQKLWNKIKASSTSFAILVIFLRGVICCVNFKQLRSTDSIKVNCGRQSSYVGLGQSAGAQPGGKTHLIVQTQQQMTTKLLSFCNPRGIGDEQEGGESLGGSGGRSHCSFGSEHILQHIAEHWEFENAWASEKNCYIQCGGPMDTALCHQIT